MRLKSQHDALMWSTKSCLTNIITQYQNTLCNQKDGIITGDNHSISLANIPLHYVVCQVSTEVEHAEIFKRFIDDTVWVSFGNQDTENIIAKAKTWKNGFKPPTTNESQKPETIV